MAIHAHSTPVPAPQRGLLRATLATVEAEFGDLVAQPWPVTISVQSDPKPDVPSDGGCCDIETPSVRHGRACHDTVAVGVRCGGITTPDVPHGAARGPTAPIAGPLPSLGGRTHTCTVNRADIGTPSAAEATGLKCDALLPFEPDTAAQARALHARRELHQALDFGFALLDALDLPPFALDVIDNAIAHLDALDAPAEDLEPSLGWTESGPRFFCDYQDCELDTADYEDSLGAPENHPGRWHIDMASRYHASSRHHPLGDQTHWGTGAVGDVEDDGDHREPEAGYDLPEGDDERCASGDVDQEYSCGWTAKVDQVHLGHAQDEQEEAALERHGRGFVRSGPEDAEDDELGDEHAPETMEWMFGPKRNTEADRQSFTAWRAAAEVAYV